MIIFSVAPGQKELCQSLDIINLDSPDGYIGLQTLQDSDVYLNDCLWSIEAPVGQKVSLVLHSFMYGQIWRKTKIKGTKLWHPIRKLPRSLVQKSAFHE